MKRAVHILITGGLFFLLLFTGVGCLAEKQAETTESVIPEGLSPEPALQPEYAAARPSDGSLFSGNSRFLFEDTKAMSVGDTVIVDIVENTSSSMDVNTETGRTSEMSIGVPNFFGFMRQYESLENPVTKGMLADKMVGTKYENSLEAEGQSDRSGQVAASIAARITKVLPNGNLNIYGRKATKVNDETQYIVVSGIVRPGDITSDNRVESVCLADSRIEYYGKGTLADKQKPGWGTRIFDNLWPF